MKILKSNPISPFGGLNFVLEEFNSCNINKSLNQYLPDLASQCVYGWKDLLYSFWSIYFCGGDCIEDLSGNFKHHIEAQPYLKIPSPDRVLDRMKELSVPSSVCTSPRGISKHEISSNNLLGQLNLAIAKRLGLLNKEELILDYDNTILFTEKDDARMSYKRKNGYCPGVGVIGDTVVFIENRNGNSDAKTLQHETLKRMFNLFSNQNIKINTFRADGASFQFSVFKLLEKNVDNIYIRACMRAPLSKCIAEIDNWESVDLGDEIAFRGEASYTPFIRDAKRNKEEHLLKTYRLVVTKVARKDKQINAFTGEAYNYSAIITTDWKKTKHEVVEFYNQRGAMEKEFDVLKNDFGWKNLPFSKLEQNTVFLFFTAMCRNLYSYIITSFSKKFKHLKPIFRIKKFIFRFITIPAKWIKKARRWHLRIYSKIAFKT